MNPFEQKFLNQDPFYKTLKTDDERMCYLSLIDDGEQVARKYYGDGMVNYILEMIGLGQVTGKEKKVKGDPKGEEGQPPFLVVRYKCYHCGQIFETDSSMGDEPKEEVSCPKCGKDAKLVQQYVESGKKQADNNIQELQPLDLHSKKINELAEMIRQDWKNISPFAKPYLDAMFYLEDITDDYYQDTGASIVAYFLSNANTWKGETARAIKKELKQRLDYYYNKSGTKKLAYKDEAMEWDKDEAMEWAKTIAQNYKDETDTDVLSQLYDACNELGLDKAKMDKRWQQAQDYDLQDWKMVYFILTGEQGKWFASKYLSSWKKKAYNEENIILKEIRDLPGFPEGELADWGSIASNKAFKDILPELQKLIQKTEKELIIHAPGEYLQTAEGLIIPTSKLPFKRTTPIVDIKNKRVFFEIRTPVVDEQGNVIPEEGSIPRYWELNIQPLLKTKSQLTEKEVKPEIKPSAGIRGGSPEYRSKNAGQYKKAELTITVQDMDDWQTESYHEVNNIHDDNLRRTIEWMFEVGKKVWQEGKKMITIDYEEPVEATKQKEASPVVDQLTPVQKQAYTCLMSKGEKVCRAEFGDKIIDIVLGKFIIPANKKISKKQYLSNWKKTSVPYGTTHRVVGRISLDRKNAEEWLSSLTARGWKIYKEKYNEYPSAVVYFQPYCFAGITFEPNWVDNQRWLEGVVNLYAYRDWALDKSYREVEQMFDEYANKVNDMLMGFPDWKFYGAKKLAQWIGLLPHRLVGSISFDRRSNDFEEWLSSLTARGWKVYKEKFNIESEEYIDVEIQFGDSCFASFIFGQYPGDNNKLWLGGVITIYAYKDWALDKSDQEVKQMLDEYANKVNETLMGNPEWNFYGKESVKKLSYIKHCPGHKNSQGESAEWCIVSHESGEIISSHKTEADAKSHLQDMHTHGGAKKNAGRMSALYEPMRESREENRREREQEREYSYHPVMSDKFHPNIVEGRAIEENTVVKITKLLDKEAIVRDSEGNEQLVKLESLKIADEVRDRQLAELVMEVDRKIKSELGFVNADDVEKGWEKYKARVKNDVPRRLFKHMVSYGVYEYLIAHNYHQMAEALMQMGMVSKKRPPMASLKKFVKISEAGRPNKEPQTEWEINPQSKPYYTADGYYIFHDIKGNKQKMKMDEIKVIEKGGKKIVKKISN